MSVTSDPAGVTVPKDPAEYRRRGSAPGLWTTIAFGVVCVLAGAAAALLAPRLLAGPRAPSLTSAMATLGAEPAAAIPIQAAAPAPPPAPAATSSDDLIRLSARIAALETQETRVNQAAAGALAAAALLETAQSSRPFVAELAALQAAAPATPELAALSRVAETGAPSRAVLAASFPDYAARAAVASHTPGDKAGLGERITYALMRIVTVRRVGEVTGDTPDARLARAEQLVEDGDIDAALRALDRLSPAAREALAPWRAGAERRAEIDRATAGLRARALQSLTATGRGGG